VRVLLVAVLVANGVLLAPYARAIWWLHAYRFAPAIAVVPVSGVLPIALHSSFGAPRGGGRWHEGIDILAPAGTPVLAAADGIIVGNRPTPIGGTVLWVLGAGRRLYYYAHMRELAPGMRLGRLVRAAEVLGSVGTTGNAKYTPPHLHFAIYVVESLFYPLRYEAIDPYPVLLAATTR
jgi:peptidoglycan LD-endopeptidase LytH